jgi:hypothetical protein
VHVKEATGSTVAAAGFSLSVVLMTVPRENLLIHNLQKHIEEGHGEIKHGQRVVRQLKKNNKLRGP